MIGLKLKIWGGIALSVLFSLFYFFARTQYLEKKIVTGKLKRQEHVNALSNQSAQKAKVKRDELKTRLKELDDNFDDNQFPDLE